MLWLGVLLPGLVLAYSTLVRARKKASLPFQVSCWSGYGTFTYVYDFGDNWQHKVKVEKIVELDAPLARPLCIAGANACPPENVGGAPGYAEFLEALADPANPEHDSLSEWSGGSFDPTHFGIDEVNWRLRGE